MWEGPEASQQRDSDGTQRHTAVEKSSMFPQFLTLLTLCTSSIVPQAAQFLTLPILWTSSILLQTPVFLHLAVNCLLDSSNQNWSQAASSTSPTFVVFFKAREAGGRPASNPRGREALFITALESSCGSSAVTWPFTHLYENIPHMGAFLFHQDVFLDVQPKHSHFLFLPISLSSGSRCYWLI